MTKDKYIEKARKSLAIGVNVESKLLGEASQEDAGKALIRFYTLLGVAILLFLGGIGIGLMFWLMK